MQLSLTGMTLGASKANSHIFSLSSVGSSGKRENRLEEGGVEDIVDSRWLEIATIYQNTNISLRRRALISKIKYGGDSRINKGIIVLAFDDEVSIVPWFLVVFLDRALS